MAMRALRLAGLSLLLTLVLAAQPPERPAGYRLADAASPYLRQHATDPVAWHPWGPEAFRLAAETDRPVFLSIGYSACHWCHVMQRESFLDPKIAARLNRDFVPIKVDREERPDVDAIYMEACKRFSKHGAGWPLNAFLTSDKQPYYVGTYYPPVAGHGRPAFGELLDELTKAWKEDRKLLVARAERYVSDLAARQSHTAGEELPAPTLLARAAFLYRSSDDTVHGGFGDAPKFPRPSGPMMLLRQSLRDEEASSREVVRRQLDAMARGAIRDHLQGGWHRYTVDRRWLIPHFEKMLYDQALIADLYLEAAVILDVPEYRDLCRETLDALLRDWPAEAGGFIAAFDADTHHEEGWSYTWTEEDVAAVLTEDLEREVFVAHAGIEGEPEMEHGRHVIHHHRDLPTLSSHLERPEAEVRAALDRAFGHMRSAARARDMPRRDAKVLTEWNALAISALAKAGRLLDEPRYVQAAATTYHWLEANLRSEEGAWRRAFAKGQAHHDAVLADLAALLIAALDLHEATLDPSWLTRATELVPGVAAFADEEGLFHESRADDLVVQPVRVEDGAHPSGTSLALLGLTRLAVVTENKTARQLAERGFRAIGPWLDRESYRAPHALIALDLLHGPSPRVALHGNLKSKEGQALVRALAEVGSPFVAITVGTTGEEAPFAVVCVDTTCLEPARTPEELRAAITQALDPFGPEGG